MTLATPELPAWLVEGALVWERVDNWKPWKKYRVRRVKACCRCWSGYMVTLQWLEPPLYGWGREVDSSFCREASEDDPVPDMSWDGNRPIKSVDTRRDTKGRPPRYRGRHACVSNNRSGHVRDDGLLDVVRERDTGNGESFRGCATPSTRHSRSSARTSPRIRPGIRAQKNNRRSDG